MSQQHARHFQMLLKAIANLSFVLLVFVATLQAAFAESEDDAKQALAEQGANWYDAETDDFRPLEVEITEEPVSHRDSDWVGKPSQSQTQTTPTTTPTATAGPSLLGSATQVIFWVFVVLIVVAVLGVVVWLILSARMEEDEPTEIKQRVSSDVDRVEALPFKVRRPESDLLSEARRHYEAGEYQEAIIYLFSYQLVEMDKHNNIRLAKGKTNRQYLREVGRRHPLAGVVGDTMVAFEDVFFGHYPLTRERFESCWKQLDEFHRHLGSVNA